MAVELIAPSLAHLDSYVEALRRRWSPSTTRPEAADEELAAIADDPTGFLTGKDDREGRLPDIALPDGSTRRRLPGFTRWMWDGEFCGSINARWQPGTVELPAYVLGHIGYSVVPWKRRRGVATDGLRIMLTEVRALGLLPWVELTTDDDNIGSQRVIEANGGVLVERFTTLPAYGATPSLRYRIDLASPPT